MSRFLSHEMQIIITVLIVLAILFYLVKIVRRYGVTGKVSKGMFIGLICGSLLGYFFFNPVILAFLGMILGTTYVRKC